MRSTVLVVGGGLAGLVASLEIVDSSGSKVVLIDQEPRLGGNSAKASSGMNVLTSDDGDKAVDYEADVIRSGGTHSNPELVHVLVQESNDALRFLTDKGIDMSKTVQLGGHSHARTHRNASGPNVGFAIMKTLIDHVSSNPNIDVRTSCKLLKLYNETDKNGADVLCLPEDDGGMQFLPADAVILCTGGFAASQDALRRWAPGLEGLPTTNGPQATGDGMLAGEQIGAELVDIDQVQVHPTGFIDPADPSNPHKFLAPEALRGSGAILLDADGRRFTDELATRDKVVAAMREARQPLWLVLPSAGAEVFGEPTVNFYTSKGLMTKCETVADAAVTLGVSAETLHEQLKRYNAVFAGHERDDLGRSVYPVEFDIQAPLWVAQVTPVVHYCMGGIKMSVRGEALTAAGDAVPGLFAAGEVTGGLHGCNRLAGNSLLDCVVFGRRAAQSACQYVKKQLVSDASGE